MIKQQCPQRLRATNNWKSLEKGKEREIPQLWHRKNKREALLRVAGNCYLFFQQKCFNSFFQAYFLVHFCQ